MRRLSVSASGPPGWVRVRAAAVTVPTGTDRPGRGRSVHVCPQSPAGAGRRLGARSLRSGQVYYPAEV